MDGMHRAKRGRDDRRCMRACEWIAGMQTRLGPRGFVEDAGRGARYGDEWLCQIRIRQRLRRSAELGGGQSDGVACTAGATLVIIGRL